MQIKIFNIPIGAEDTQVDELNHFLRANKIIDVKRELAMLDGRGCWSFCITYMLSSKPLEQHKQASSAKADYKEILEPEIFEKFTQMRKIRKMIAESEAVPAYAVFTDAELSEMAKLPELSISTMEKIPGIGKKKIEKYGSVFLQETNQLDHEA